MAGSYSHCEGENREFRFDLIENMGDAHEACEEMYWMIRYLTEDNPTIIKHAIDEYYKTVRGERNPEDFS